MVLCGAGAWSVASSDGNSCKVIHSLNGDVLEFGHFTIYKVSNTHTPQQEGSVCMCAGCKCAYLSFYISLFLCAICHGVKLFVSKKPQQIHMYLINVDDNTPKVQKKQRPIKNK